MIWSIFFLNTVSVCLTCMFVVLNQIFLANQKNPDICKEGYSLSLKILSTLKMKKVVTVISKSLL